MYSTEIPAPPVLFTRESAGQVEEVRELDALTSQRDAILEDLLIQGESVQADATYRLVDAQELIRVMG